MARPKILIVDDEKPTRDVLAKILSSAGECTTEPDAERALAALAANPDTALMITDYKMPGMNGVELVRRAKAEHPSLACILLTAFGEIDLAVEAMREGADDFLTKPVTDIAQMELRVAKALEKHALARKVEELQSEIDGRRGIESFTGKSPAMEKVYRLIRQAAKSNASVLVEGPSGTGKELVARALHDLSPRAQGPFVAVECAALSPTLIESELFGHEKGAFTGAERRNVGRFEAADGGTLFLDEITEIDLATQVKLLRVLESRRVQRVGGGEDIPVDFRLVAATNRDLAAYVREGRFREDLYYRLNVIDIHLPPLKDRPGDIALLAARFVREFSKENGGSVTGIDARAMQALESYDWPGNVRQLRNAVEKMVVLSSGGKLTLDDVPPEILAGGDDGRAASPIAAAGRGGEDGRAASPLAAVRRGDDDGRAASPFAAAGRVEGDAPYRSPATLADAEKDAILSALAGCGNNKTRAAERLGISRRTLHRKLKEWGLR